MLKSKTLTAYVLFYDFFEYKSFPVATWHATERHSLWSRILLVGAAARYERKRGKVDSNATYMITIRMPHGALSRTVYTKVIPLCHS